VQLILVDQAAPHHFPFGSADTQADGVVAGALANVESLFVVVVTASNDVLFF
jgi:hypothetical protein